MTRTGSDGKGLDEWPFVKTSDRPTEPTLPEMREPSTQKEVDEEPRAPRGQERDPEPSHQAEGTGVIAPERPDADEAPL